MARIAVMSFVIVGLLAPDLAQAACIAPKRPLATELYENNWESEIAQLDDLASQLWAHPELRAEVIIYGPRRGHRNEVPTRMKAFAVYLRGVRGVAPEKVAIRAGGFREKAAMEIWLLGPDSCPVPATPTVLTREVVYTPGRFVVVYV
jgi:hypothetical protein